MNLIQNYQSILEGTQKESRFLKLVSILPSLQIAVDRAWPLFSDLPGKSGFAYLTRPNQGYSGLMRKCFMDLWHSFPVNHHCILNTTRYKCLANKDGYANPI